MLSLNLQIICAVVEQQPSINPSAALNKLYGQL
jgi:hypothetical protein